VLSVESLQSAVRRIRAEVVGPYEQIKHKTQQLRNIHATVDILRHVIHRLKLAQKLRAQLAVPAAQLDLAKAAKLITDIKAVDAEADLSGIDAVAADAEWLESARKSVQEQAEVGELRLGWGAPDGTPRPKVARPHQMQGVGAPSVRAQMRDDMALRRRVDAFRRVGGTLAGAVQRKGRVMPGYQSPFQVVTKGRVWFMSTAHSLVQRTGGSIPWSDPTRPAQTA
jgi:hypothetical protein